MESKEYQAFKSLYNQLKTGVRSGIADVVAKAFSRGLIPPQTQRDANNLMLGEDQRTVIVLDAVHDRITSVPAAYEEFACLLEEIIAFKYLATMMRSGLTRVDEKPQPSQISQDVKESVGIQYRRQDSDQKQQLNSDIKTVQRKYASLLTSTRESLKERQKKPVELVAHLLGFRVFLAVLKKEDILLADQHDDLIRAESIEAIFITLSRFWSFLDYEILEDIIEKFGAVNDRQNLNEYVESLKEFFDSWKVEPGKISLQQVIDGEDTRVKMYFKLDVNSLRQYRNIKAAVARIFGVKVHSLCLCSIEEGCIELVFLYPKVAADTVLPLSEARRAELAQGEESALETSLTETTSPHTGIKESQQPESATGPTITSSPIDVEVVVKRSESATRSSVPIEAKKSESTTGTSSIFEVNKSESTTGTSSLIEEKKSESTTGTSSLIEVLPPSEVKESPQTKETGKRRKWERADPGKTEKKKPQTKTSFFARFRKTDRQDTELRKRRSSPGFFARLRRRRQPWTDLQVQERLQVLQRNPYKLVGRDVSTPLKTSPTETSTPHTVEGRSMSAPSHSSTSPKGEPEPDATKESDVADV